MRARPWRMLLRSHYVDQQRRRPLSLLLSKSFDYTTFSPVPVGYFHYVKKTLFLRNVIRSANIIIMDTKKKSTGYTDAPDDFQYDTPSISLPKYAHPPKGKKKEARQPPR